MKISYFIIALLLFFSQACGKERNYSGSTPANSAVRTFLGIPLSDSIDFIRWKLSIRDSRYQLHCNYGIGKANTKGFINDGKKVELSGQLQKDENVFQLRNGSKTIKFVELNSNLLHFMNEDKRLMVGNAGWSYTLNNISPVASGQFSLKASPDVLKDSMAFEGRTPCNVPGVMPAGAKCYKLKWSIVFYTNAEGKDPGSYYKVMVTPWRQEGGRRGTWKIISGQNNRTMYQLNDDQGNGSLFLLKLDENILVFTDAKGNPLVGNEDFSYTLNAR